MGTAAIALMALPAGGIPITAIVFIFLGHILIDRTSFVDLMAIVLSPGYSADTHQSFNTDAACTIKGLKNLAIPETPYLPFYLPVNRPN